MPKFLPFILPAVFFLVLEALWVRPAWFRLPPAAREGWERRRPPPVAPDRDPDELRRVRHRLQALAVELGRLERDREVFAAAHHARAVRAAYDGLLAEAARLAAVQTIEVEIDRGIEIEREIGIERGIGTGRGIEIGPDLDGPRNLAR